MSKTFAWMVIISILYSATAFSKNYKGAEIYSKAQMKYGRFEMSMKAGAGSGLLFTFFLYKNGSEQSGAFWEEIDLEIFGKNNARSFQSNIITDGVTGSNKMSEKLHTYAFSLADTFHTYRVEWTPTYVAWFFDDQEIRRDQTTQVATLTNAESIRFNAWISSSSGWAGAFNPGVLPQYQLIDWLKYSSYVAGTENTFKPEWTDDFNTFNTTRWSKATWTFDGNLADFSASNAYTKDGMLVLALTDPLATGVEELDSPVGGIVYPNPASETLRLRGELMGQYDSYTIYNALGAAVQTLKLSPSQSSININKLKKGLYTIKFSSKEGAEVHRFVKD